MAPIKVTASTMGVSTPATVSQDAGSVGYRWHGIAGWPLDPATVTSSAGTPERSDRWRAPNSARSRLREERKARCAELAAEGMKPDPIAAEMGLNVSTVRRYLAEVNGDA